MPRVAFKTLGCRLNQADTDHMAEQLAAHGYEVVRDTESPDVVIINTCTVTREATSASRSAARRAALDEKIFVVVAGCYPTAEPAEAGDLPGVRLVISNEQKDRVADLLSENFKSKISGDRPVPIRAGAPMVDRRRRNLRVQTGCDEFCTFCIIPTTRGPLRSYPASELIEQARRQVESGTRELVLTGVHLGKFGWDNNRPEEALLELLEGLLGIPQLARIRLSSILSNHLTPHVIRLIAQEPRICRFLHVPLQSGDDAILERMHRPYRVAGYKAVVESLKSEIAGVGLSTDVIVGFPGETADQFRRTVALADEIAFLKIHVFRYSARPGTPAAGWDDQINEAEKRLRSKELINVASKTRLAFHEAEVGKVREVLVEQAYEDGSLSGHTDNFVTVKFRGDSSLVGGLAAVAIEFASVDSVRGTFVNAIPWDMASPRREL